MENHLKVIFCQVHQFIKANLSASVDWPDLVTALDHGYNDYLHNNAFSFPLLPIIVLGAISNQQDDELLEPAIPLAAAWFTINLSSDIIDDAQDQDGQTKFPWSNWHPFRAVNVGVGLIGCAQMFLASLKHRKQSVILADWAQTLVLAAQGQNISTSNHSLDEYYQHIIANTGLIFSSVALAGAHLGTDDDEILTAASDYGMNLGILMQLGDDVQDLLPQSDQNSDLATGTFSLPVIYALSQANPQQHRTLSSIINAPKIGSDDLTTVFKILDDLDAFAYSLTVSKEFETKSLAALNKLPENTWRIHLEELIQSGIFPLQGQSSHRSLKNSSL